jgi:hypothetical protein
MSSLRAVTESVCGRLGCEPPLPRIPGTSQILQPRFGQHPMNPDSLSLVLILTNRAPRRQRYPLLQLELYDDKAELLAAWRFTADSYLPGSNQAGLGAWLAANVTLHLAMTEVSPAGFRARLI